MKCASKPYASTATISLPASRFPWATRSAPGSPAGGAGTSWAFPASMAGTPAATRRGPTSISRKRAGTLSACKSPPGASSVGSTTSRSSTWRSPDGRLACARARSNSPRPSASPPTAPPERCAKSTTGCCARRKTPRSPLPPRTTQEVVNPAPSVELVLAFAFSALISASLRLRGEWTASLVRASGFTLATLHFTVSEVNSQHFLATIVSVWGSIEHMRYLCGILSVCFFLAAAAHAQMSGRIRGSVIDASGAAVGGAEVELYLAGGQKPLLASKTSEEGLYYFIGVRPAEYDLAVSAMGVLKSTLRGITVDMARETDIPRIKLELAGVTQSVEVSAEVAGVDVSTAEVSTTVSMEQIKNLPILDRDVLSIMQTN